LAVNLRTRERAILVTVVFQQAPYHDAWPAEDVVAELRELVRSTGVEILGELLVVRDIPTPRLLMGSGKAEAIRALVEEREADVVIVSHDLSSAQQRNLEEIVGVKVIDRTQLILDIFAHRAHSQEGKVQVALAQHEYLLPRLAGKGILLSRLGGGIGTRGPGEQKLEVDRRRIRARIAKLTRDLTLIRRRRGSIRRERQRRAVPTVALVGYTNAGKSTLLNRLTDAQAAVQDQLFTTLDPVSRRLLLPTHQTIVLSDTVGFLHQLPHHLIEAFQATLEEVREAHLLLHVVDASHPWRNAQMLAVEQVLQELHAHGKAPLVVFNKMDRLGVEAQRQLRRQAPDAVLLSALTGEGVPHLVDRLVHLLTPLLVRVTARVPQGAQQWVHRIYQDGAVIQRRDASSGVYLEAWVPPELKGLLVKAGFLTGHLTP